MEKKYSLINALYLQRYFHVFLMFSYCAIYTQFKRNNPSNAFLILGANFQENSMQFTIATKEIEMWMIFSNNLFLSPFGDILALTDNAVSITFPSTDIVKKLLEKSFSESKCFNSCFLTIK